MLWLVVHRPHLPQNEIFGGHRRLNTVVNELLQVVDVDIQRRSNRERLTITLDETPEDGILWETRKSTVTWK